MPSAIFAARGPARRNSPSPSALCAILKMIVAPMDWQMLAERGTAWMSYWDRHVRGGDRMVSR